MRVAKKKMSSEKKKVLSIFGVFLYTTFDEVFLFDFYIVILNESSECSALLPIALFLRKKMSKRKSENSDSEDKEPKRRKRLEEAKRFIERTNFTYKDAALKYQVDQRSLSRFIKDGFQKLRRPSLL